MNILSLFNGISGLHLSCDKAGIKVDKCYYSEIDKFSNKVTECHYPNDIALGDVTKWREWDIDWSTIDLVGAGFPCQSWSVAGHQLGDKDERGMLFWTTLEIISNVLKQNPNAKFLMENVKMKKEFEQYITHHTEQALGRVEKILINSALVSAQNRNRYYWTNFGVTQPEDKGILLKDVLENGDFPDRAKSLTVTTRVGCETAKRYLEKSMHQMVIKAGNVNPSGCGMNGNVYDLDSAKSPCLTTNKGEGIKITYRPASIVGRRLNDRGVREDYNKSLKITQCLQVKHKNEKMGCLTTLEKDTVLSTEAPGRYTDIYGRNDILYRKLTPLECERLQTLPDNWTSILSNTQRYKSIGNGWTIDVIVHILKCAFS